MEKHGNVTIDFRSYGGDRKDVRIPFHLTMRELIEELSEIYGYSEIQKKEQYQSCKALISEQFITGKQTLLETNVKEGEILEIIK